MMMKNVIKGRGASGIVHVKKDIFHKVKYHVFLYAAIIFLIPLNHVNSHYQ